jgi:hypothetical protein
MSILVYKDDACTQQIKTPQKFTRSSSVTPYQVFNLSKMTGAELAQLYKFDGTNHIRLIPSTDYVISGPNITLVTPLGISEVLIAVPVDRLNLNFGGVFGSTKTSTTFVVFKREPAYTYDTLLLSSENLDVVPFAQTFIDTTVVCTANQSMTNSSSQIVSGSKCESANLVGLTINALEGYVLVLNNTYIGKIIANEVNAILVDNLSYAYAGDVSDDLNIYSVGSLLYALDTDGSIPASNLFKPVITIPALDVGHSQQKIWVRDTVTIPETATNYPNMAFKLTGIEYLA